MAGVLNALGRFPWSLLIVLAMWLSYTTDIDLSGTLGLIFIGLCVFVLIIEFFKSGDIRIGPFMMDLLFAAIGLVAASSLITVMVMGGKGLSFHYILGCLVLVIDAILSPYNSFRTALRNVQLGGDNG
ncbi:MAG: hypothetical protein MUF57_02620 [Gammaproteobacteria bacterium]|jgi:hypothetical protein|nr:hypothetical protein [Gammaproteobacteria bacterium]